MTKTNNHQMLELATEFVGKIEPAESNGDISASELKDIWTKLRLWLLKEEAKHEQRKVMTK